MSHEQRLTENEMAPLVRALLLRQDEYGDALDRIRDIAGDGADEEIHKLTALLRENVELAGVLRRAVASLSLQQLRGAFGAPGDFGYETPLGAALAQVYSAPAMRIIDG